MYEFSRAFKILRYVLMEEFLYFLSGYVDNPLEFVKITFHTIIIAFFIFAFHLFYNRYRYQIPSPSSSTTTISFEGVPVQEKDEEEKTNESRKGESRVRTLDFLRKSTELTSGIREAISVPSHTDSGRKLRKREKALMLAEKFMGLRKPIKSFKQKDVPSFYLNADNDVNILGGFQNFDFNYLGT